MAIKKKKGPGYHIPYSFLYKYLSAPNYFWRNYRVDWMGCINLECFRCSVSNMGNSKSIPKSVSSP